MGQVSNSKSLVSGNVSTDAANAEGSEQGEGFGDRERENLITTLNGLMERAFHLESGFCLMPLCSN